MKDFFGYLFAIIMSGAFYYGFLLAFILIIYAFVIIFIPRSWRRALFSGSEDDARRRRERRRAKARAERLKLSPPKAEEEVSSDSDASSNEAAWSCTHEGVSSPNYPGAEPPRSSGEP